MRDPRPIRILGPDFSILSQPLNLSLLTDWGVPYRAPLLPFNPRRTQLRLRGVKRMCENSDQLSCQPRQTPQDTRPRPVRYIPSHARETCPQPALDHLERRPLQPCGRRILLPVLSPHGSSNNQNRKGTKLPEANPV